MELKALLLTILVGIFFIIGMIIPRFFQNKNKLIFFTTGLSFIIMLTLIAIDLLPETMEVLESLKTMHQFFLIIGVIVLGIGILKILDLLIPTHHHHHQEQEDDKVEHNAHIYHIGFITGISLMIHNFLEGISIYIASISDYHLGIIMALSVGFHNLPLGVEIAASMDAKQEKKYIKCIVIFLLSITSFLGAFILFLAKKELNNIIEGTLLSLTIGMLLYISFIELLPEIKRNWHTKEIKGGLIAGIIFSAIMCFL